MASKTMLLRMAIGPDFYPQNERFSSLREALDTAVAVVSYEHDWADIWALRKDRCVLIFSQDEIQKKADLENEKRGVKVWNFDIDSLDPLRLFVHSGKVN